MPGDDDIIDDIEDGPEEGQENIEQSVEKDDALEIDSKTESDRDSAFGPKDESVETTKPRAKLWLASLVGGLALALGAGAVGGFVSHEFFDAPPPPPNLSGFEAQIKEIETQAAKQTRQNVAMESQIKSLKTQLEKDVSALERKWADKLTVIEGKIAEGANSNGPNIKLSEDLKIRIDETGTPKFIEDESRENEAGEASQASIDPNPQLAADLKILRSDIDTELSAVKRRLKILERAKDTALKQARHAALKEAHVFPAADILAGLAGPEEKEAPKGWFGRLTDKHVSVTRTGQEAAADVLTQIETAIAAGDWETAMRLSDDLPEPARSAAQDWITGTRP